MAKRWKKFFAESQENSWISKEFDLDFTSSNTDVHSICNKNISSRVACKMQWGSSTFQANFFFLSRKLKYNTVLMRAKSVADKAYYQCAC